ncbi:helix-turn-helix domain-containing protein [Burkholderia cenocepacia]|uniref:helix-turn-helix domain-containing protein n=1 Tax=Burkholderia cenocepacia TaxID=95486 RepID=UPI001CF58FCD|nr:helix-turn-helix transcriptional regulator [Burkholderia cenocepacia]MCA8008631.1 helix-turn-helix domain-containing protein [Burkholderia cenocepacia]
MNDGLLDWDGFAVDLKRLRTQQGMTEQELGEKIGRSAKCIRDYEAGVTRPQLMTLHTLNDVLIGRNSWGMKVVDTPEGARPFFNLKDVPNDLLAAEVQRRLLAGKSE